MEHHKLFILAILYTRILVKRLKNCGGETKMASQALEQMLGNVLVPTIGQERMYQTIDVYTAGTTALYTPPPKPFEPMIGPIGGPGSPGGILHRPDYLEGGLERYRQPEWDPVHGNHMNYETLIPGIKKPIINIHIPMDD